VSRFLKVIALWLVALQVIASPSISRITPLAVAPGKKTILSFSGSGLDSVSNLWTSFSGTARRIASTNDDVVRFELTCPETASGIHALQLSGTEGASNFELVLVDSLPGQPSSGEHPSQTNAQAIPIPSAVDRTAKPEQAEYYRFTASVGDRLSIEVIAHRLGSEMDPVLHVYNAEGRELVFCDDEPGVWRDARLVFNVPSTGDYLVGVHDSGYGGGANFAYRLRVTHDPLIWYTYPLIDPSEVIVPFEPFGSLVANPNLSSPANPPQNPGLSGFPSIAEMEPNSSPAQAQTLFLPCVVNGKIEIGSDLDYFAFNAEKDEKLVFQSQTRALGSPCDLVLAVKTAEGKTIAQSDSNQPADAALTNKFSDAGKYLLEVRDLSGNTQPNVPYRIKLSRFQSGVIASSENNRLESTPGGTANLKLLFARFDYTGPITLDLESPVDGVTLENSQVPEKKNEVELKVKFSQAAKPGFFTHFKIKATPESPGAGGPVSTLPALQKAFPLMLNCPIMLEGLFTLAVKAN